MPQDLFLQIDPLDQEMGPQQVPSLQNGSGSDNNKREVLYSPKLQNWSPTTKHILVSYPHYLFFLEGGLTTSAEDEFGGKFLLFNPSDFNEN